MSEELIKLRGDLHLYRDMLQKIDDRLVDAIELSKDRRNSACIDILHAIQREIRVKVQ